MDSTNTDDGEEGNKSLRNHGHVDGNGVTLLDAHLLEHCSQLADFAQKLSVRDCATSCRLVGLVDDGGAVRVLNCVAIDAVVAGVQPALEEPAHIAVLERTILDRLEGDVPVKQFAGALSPELVGVLDGLLVEHLVFFEVDVRFCGVLAGERRC